MVPRIFMKLLICVTGMPGSGKGVVSEVAKELGIPVVSLGDVVREEARRLGLEITAKNLLEVAKKLREEEGRDAVVKRVAKKISSMHDEVILVDGIRNIEEIDYLKKVGKVVILAIHASPKERFKRIIKRGRVGDPKDFQEFMMRDLTELKLGIGSVIALADYMLINEGINEEEFRERVKNLLTRIVSEFKG